MLILSGQLQRSERRVEALASDPNSSLAEIAGALREVNELRPDRDELEELLGELQRRAHEFRARWARLGCSQTVSSTRFPSGSRTTLS